MFRSVDKCGRPQLSLIFTHIASPPKQVEEFCRNLAHEFLSMSRYVRPKMISVCPKKLINLFIALTCQEFVSTILFMTKIFEWRHKGVNIYIYFSKKSVYCFYNAFLHLLASKGFITSLISLFKYKRFRNIKVFNFYLPSGPVHLYLLDESISNFRGVWLFVLKFYGPVNNYGHVEPVSYPLTLFLNVGVSALRVVLWPPSLRTFCFSFTYVLWFFSLWPLYHSDGGTLLVLLPQRLILAVSPIFSFTSVSPTVLLLFRLVSFRSLSCSSCVISDNNLSSCCFSQQQIL